MVPMDAGYCSIASMSGIMKNCMHKTIKNLVLSIEFMLNYFYFQYI